MAASDDSTPIGDRRPPPPNPEDRKKLFKQQALKEITAENARVISDEAGLDCSEEELEAYRKVANQFLAEMSAIDEEPDPPLRDIKYPRTPGHAPQSKDNPYNAWVWRCEVKGAAAGKLAGRRVSVKDNIAVACVPMSAGSAMLEGYIPEYDATVVTRILDAGATIIGKTACTEFNADNNSFCGRQGPTSNPWSARHSAGGSSSGAAALVAAGECDMALGSDTGGSVRIPAAFSGCVGLKVTYGLVPFTGAVDLAYHADTLGPLGRTVTDVATLLEVIAGYDEGDRKSVV